MQGLNLCGSVWVRSPERGMVDQTRWVRPPQLGSRSYGSAVNNEVTG